MHLIGVDAGNTSLKLARVAAKQQHLFWRESSAGFAQVSATGWLDSYWPDHLQEHSLRLKLEQHQDAVADFSYASIAEFRNDLDGPSCWAIVSVNPPVTTALIAWLKNNYPQDDIQQIQAADIPLASDVVSREQLGKDRLLASWLVSALAISQNQQATILVDAGTAVTIDLVDVVADQRCFVGGLIFPGAGTNLRSLEAATASLPRLSRARTDQVSTNQDAEFVVGKCTESAIRRGVERSQLHAIVGCVSEIAAACQGKTAICLTGGGLADRPNPFPIKDAIYIPELTLLATLILSYRRGWIE